MKKSRLSIFIIVLIFRFAGSSAAGNFKSDTVGGNQLVIREANELHVTATLLFNTLNFKDVTTQYGIFTELHSPGLASTLETGKPKLPVKRDLIEIPAKAKAYVRVTGSKYEDYVPGDMEYHRILPLQAPVSKNAGADPVFLYDSLFYQVDAFYPSELANIDMLGFMRGLRLGRLNISSVQYNPLSQVLRVYKEINIEIVFEGGNSAETQKRKKLNDSPFFSGLEQVVLNKAPVAMATDTSVHFPVKYVIIADPMFQNALQPFVEWKKKKGFRVIEAYTNNPNVGATTISIKAYLQAMYNNATPADPAPAFVLLAGDVNLVPTFSGNTGTHPSDMYYCEYTGDMLPDAYYGRFSATTEVQMIVQISKTLEYEQYTMPDPTFLNQCVMIGGMDSYYGPTNANGQINYGTTYYFNPAHGLTSHTYLYPNSGSMAAQIIQDINNGCCFANYTAHANIDGWFSPAFTTANVPALTNSHKYPLMIGNACLSNKFDEPECFGEALLRASNKGAIGYIGGSDNTYWDEDYYWGTGFKAVSANPVYDAANLGAYDRTFHDHGESPSQWNVTQGQMIFAGNLAVTAGSPSMSDYYWEIYHLMGDPSLMIYYSQAPAMAATYNPVVAGSTTFTVNTEAGAFAAISTGGVLHGAAVADSAGIASISITPFNSGGLADVVVTKQNRRPFTGTVNITTPGGAWCIFHHDSVNDLSGNHDGLVDYGENILLTLGIQNTGGQSADTVHVTIHSTDTFINITDSTGDYHNITSQGIVSIPGGFAFTVHNDIPDGHLVAFTIKASHGGTSWNSSFQVIAHAPVLTFAGVSVSDSAGNNNGKIDPGETVNLILTVTNVGSSNASAVLANLSSSSSFISLNSGTDSLGNIAGGGSIQAVFSITASASAPPGQQASFNLSLSGALGQTGSGNFQLSIGNVPALVVDLDPNHSSGPQIQSAVQANNLNCNYLTVFPASLGGYASVFVCLGIYDNNYSLQSTEGQTLANYLSNGGNLYLEGGDTWFFDPATAVRPYFKITGLSDGADDLGSVQGLTGTFTDGLSFIYNGENSWIDHLGPQTGTTAFTILNNLSPAYGTAVAYNGGTYRTIGTAHEFAGLANGNFPSTRNELMRRYLVFFGLLTNPISATISGTVSYGGSSPMSMNNVTIKLSQGATVLQQTTTNSSGTYTFSYVPIGTYDVSVECSKPWGGCNSVDALLIARHFVQLSPLTGLKLLAADVNHSNAVNAVDALLVQRRFVGISNSFPSGDWIFETKTVTVNAPGTLMVDISGLCLGDINASYVPPN